MSDGKMMPPTDVPFEVISRSWRAYPVQNSPDTWEIWSIRDSKGATDLSLSPEGYARAGIVGPCSNGELAFEPSCISAFTLSFVAPLAEWMAYRQWLSGYWTGTP